MNCNNCGNQIEDYALCSDCEVELRSQRRTPVELAAEDLLKACKCLIADLEGCRDLLDGLPDCAELSIKEGYQAVQKAKSPNNQSNQKNPSGPDEYKSAQ